MLKDSAAKFFIKECDYEKVKHIEETEAGYSPELWRKVAELGWTGMYIPENYGGYARGPGSGWSAFGENVCQSNRGQIGKNIVFTDAGAAEVNDSCLGCGICTHVCPQDAVHLRLIRAEDHIPA